MAGHMSFFWENTKGNSDHGVPPLTKDSIHEKAIDYLKGMPRGRLLDIPTGSGALAYALSKMGFTVSCCDVETTRFTVKNLMVDKGDLNWKIPYQDEEFDYVCFLEGLEHTENPYNAIREVSRVLKPGGTLIMSTPNYLNIERRMKFLFTGFFTKPISQKDFMTRYGGKVYDMHLNPIGYTLIRFALEASGLTIMSIAFDKKKTKQIFFKPIVLLIHLYGLFIPKAKREKYWFHETTSPDILEGGNTLILFCVKGQ